MYFTYTKSLKKLTLPLRVACDMKLRHVHRLLNMTGLWALMVASPNLGPLDCCEKLILLLNYLDEIWLMTFSRERRHPI